MAEYETSQQIKNDILFRAGEIPGASEWDIAAMSYMNRCYRAIASGASEFLPEYVDDWWWMRSAGVLTLEPVYSVGTAFVQSISSTVVLTPAPTINLLNRRIKFEGNPDVFVVTNHTGLSANVGLDTLYTGPDAAAVAFQAMKTVYALAADVEALMAPFISFRDNPQILGTTSERLEALFPLRDLSPGVPMAFSIITYPSPTGNLARFSHGGLTDGRSMRLEYFYRPTVDDLIDSPLSTPLIPLSYRHVLADMALTYVYTDKNDDRAATVLGAARATLQAMVRENRRRIVKMDNTAGAIITRPNHMNRNRLLRTDSGLIIG